MNCNTSESNSTCVSCIALLVSEDKFCKSLTKKCNYWSCHHSQAMACKKSGFPFLTCCHSNTKFEFLNMFRTDNNCNKVLKI